MTRYIERLLEKEGPKIDRFHRRMMKARLKEQWIFYHEEKDVLLIGKFNEAYLFTLKDPSGVVKEKIKYQHVKGTGGSGPFHYVGVI